MQMNFQASIPTDHNSLKQTFRLRQMILNLKSVEESRKKSIHEQIACKSTRILFTNIHLKEKK